MKNAIISDDIVFPSDIEIHASAKLLILQMLEKNKNKRIKMNDIREN